MEALNMVKKEKAPSDLLLSCFSNPIRLSFRFFVRYSARFVFSASWDRNYYSNTFIE